MTTVERFWNLVYSRNPQDVFRPLVQPFGNWLWDPVTLSILHAPIWVVLTVVASLLMIFGRKKKPLIGYARDSLLIGPRGNDAAGCLYCGGDPRPDQEIARCSR